MPGLKEENRKTILRAHHWLTFISGCCTDESVAKGAAELSQQLKELIEEEKLNDKQARTDDK